MTNHRNLHGALALVALGACTTKADPEGPPPAALSGVVRDDTGQPLPRVTISAASVGLSDQPPLSAGSAVTSTSGQYRITELDAELSYRVVARADGFDAKTETRTLVEGENTLDFSLARSVVCNAGARRCTTPPAEAAILTCNASGTGYDRQPCAAGEVCELSTTSCGTPSSLTVEVIEAGGEGRVSSSPPGIACPPDCSEPFVDGTVVLLTPTPIGESVFFRWGGSCRGSDPCTLTVHGDLMTSATFGGAGPSVTVRKVGLGAGTIASTPPGIDCGTMCTARFPSDTRVTLVATPAGRSAFDGWTGCEPTDNPRCQITATPGAVAEARFTAFYERPLGAESGCRLLLHLDRGSLAQSCGGGPDAVATGTVSFVASRNARLGDAIQAGGAGDQGWIETFKPGMNQMRSTVEMTVYRVGPAFAGAGRGTLYSDLARPDAAGVALVIEDDGRLRGITRSDAGAASEVASMPGAIAERTWYHVELLADATQGLRLKIDGELVGETPGPLAWTFTASTAWLGAARTSSVGSQERFNGRIDEVRMGDYGRR